MSLSPEQIKELMATKPKPQPRVIKTPQVVGPRPTQLGPLHWYDQTMRCAQRGCGSPCLIKVRGIPYCQNHALTILNRIVMVEIENISVEDCICNAGRHSNGNIHTHECPLSRENSN